MQNRYCLDSTSLSYNLTFKTEEFFSFVFARNKSLKDLTSFINGSFNFDCNQKVALLLLSILFLQKEISNFRLNRD